MSWRGDSNVRWLESLRGVRRGQPLARHTSFGIGGPADYLIEVNTASRLQELVAEAAARGIPLLLLGAGTNLLVADAGVEGLVIRCEARRHLIEGTSVRAEAGLKMMRLARLAADAGLEGFEFAIGVPGSVGGAVYQNAGCWGVELGSVLVEAHGCAADGRPVTWSRDDLKLGYRTSALRDGPLRGCAVLSASIQLRTGDGDASRRRMAALTRERNRSQPIKTRNCGSIFKNPPGESAGRLVEAAGLKGAREGGVKISEQHANFIVNEAGGPAADVRRLMERARLAVQDCCEVELEAEVELVGRWQE